MNNIFFILAYAAAFAVFRGLNLNIAEDVLYLNFDFFKSFPVIFLALAAAAAAFFIFKILLKTTPGSFKKFSASLLYIPALFILFLSAEIFVYIFANKSASGITLIFLRNLFIISALYPIFRFKNFFDKDFFMNDTLLAFFSFLFLSGLFILTINIFNLTGAIGLLKIIPASLAGAGFYLLLTCVFIPYSEEIVFKYFIFRPMEKKLSFIPAAAVSSIIFVILHSGGADGITAFRFIFSFSSCFLFYKTNRITSPFILHSLFNAAIYLTPYILG